VGSRGFSRARLGRRLREERCRCPEFSRDTSPHGPGRGGGARHRGAANQRSARSPGTRGWRRRWLGVGRVGSSGSSGISASRAKSPRHVPPVRRPSTWELLTRLVGTTIPCCSTPVPDVSVTACRRRAEVCPAAAEPRRRGPFALDKLSAGVIIRAWWGLICPVPAGCGRGAGPRTGVRLTGTPYRPRRWPRQARCRTSKVRPRISKRTRPCVALHAGGGINGFA
jgi:hypothetical protein